MQRMGHDSTRAAMIYLHSAQGADRAIGDALPVELDDDEDTDDDEDPDDDEDDGPIGALVPVRR